MGTTTTTTSVDDYVDDSYFSVVLVSEEDEQQQGDMFRISDEKYAESLQLQETLMSSVIASQITKMAGAPHHDHDQDDEQVIRSNRKMKQQQLESGESSQRFCGICMERKQRSEMFTNNDCHHSFCSECTSSHVAAKIQENINRVTCPDLNCQRVLEPHACQSIVPKEVFDRWVNALCESLVLGSQKFYCPFKDCSAMLVDDGGEVVRQSECPNCRRLFCAQCKVPWHCDIKCEDFQRLNKDEIGREDIMLMELAKSKKWRRCPNCKFYVEKTDGCIHISCRCGSQFCYRCGGEWTKTHGACQS